MSQSSAVSDDSDFYAEDGEAGDAQVQQVSSTAHGHSAPPSPASDAMDMDESPPASPQRVAIKRKLSPVDDSADAAPKRQRAVVPPRQYFSTAVPGTSGLPAEAWQHVFLYLAPDTLCRCLGVNKAFNQYLTSVTASSSGRLPLRKTGLKLLDSEAIWMSARKTFAPNLPRPLAGLGEMDMIQMLGGHLCQICGSPPSGQVQATSAFDAGPGPNGVRIIWPYGTRMCGPCFNTHSLKASRLCLSDSPLGSLANVAQDTDVLQTTAASLRAGLSHAFRTDDFHYVPATTLQANLASAPVNHITKVHYSKHVNDKQKDYQGAKEFGDAAAEEWLKGLPLTGKQQMADAARWERWEAPHPPGTHPAKILREYFRHVSALPAPVSRQPLVSAAVAAPPAVSASKPPPSNGSTLQVLSQQPMKHPLPARVVAASQATPSVPSSFQPPSQNAASSSKGTPSTHSVPSQQGLPARQSLPSHLLPQPQASMPLLHAPPASHHQTPAPPTQASAPPQQAQQSAPRPVHRQPRNHREVEEARLARKADIERRCREEFDPPLMPNVLQHMESFRAALQIVTPLDDHAWDVLKPRLYMQRDAAEQIEYQRGEQLRALQATIPDPSYRDAYSKSANEAAERQWEQQQTPVRKRLARLADDFIREKWNNGRGLTRHTAPVFAVEVLLYTRNTYVEKNTPKDQTNSEGPRHPSDPAFVSLENMRWLFDSKVKPITEKFCRELFMCAECDGVAKGYAFEGMIQHFGAKHTTDFSQGNIVVHWQTADWPDEPPFVPTVGDADPTLPVATANATTSLAVPGVPSGQLSMLYAALQTGQQPPVLSQNNGLGQVMAHAPNPNQQLGAYAPVPTAPPTAPPSAPAVPQFGASINTHQDQITEVATTAIEIWNSLVGVKEMVESIRVETVLHHVIERFKRRFGHEPSLDLITDALANHVLMRPVKSAQPLACKTCVSSSLGSVSMYKPYPHRLADNKNYNISSLITHFKTVHLVGGDVDWREDMIEMADEYQIKQLVSTVGMDDEKLAMVAAAFPKEFPHPLPRIGQIEASSGKTREWDSSPRSGITRKDKKKLKRKNGKRGVQDQDDAEQSDLPEAGEDEYDPRRPAFIDSAPRSRRSLGEQTSNGHTVAQTMLDPSVFTPETLAALSKLAPTLNLGTALPAPSSSRAANEASFHANQRAFQRPADDMVRTNTQPQQQEKGPSSRNKKDRESNRTRNRRLEERETEEDYTQVIRTVPATGGDYSATSLSQHPGVVPTVSPRHYAAAAAREHTQIPTSAAPGFDRVPMDQYGRPLGHEPQRHDERPVQYVDEYGRRIPYGPPPPREDVRYVDQYGREVEVVRMVDNRAPPYGPPMYEYPPYGYTQPPHGHGFAPRDYGPPMAPAYSAPPPVHQYGPHTPHPEYARHAEPSYMRGPDELGRGQRMQYVDEFGRPIPYAPPY